VIIDKKIASILWNNKTYFSKGKRGLIFISQHNNKKFVIKTKNPDSTSENIILREYENNLLLNKYKIGPKIFYYDSEKDFVIREFVDGLNFFDWIEKTKNKEKIKKMFIQILEQCKTMDDLNINKLEMNHPHKDLLIVKNKPIIIDFERCKKSLKTKNVTQFCQFITSGKLQNLTNIKFDHKKIIELCEQYKKSNNKEKNFLKLKEQIK